VRHHEIVISRCVGQTRRTDCVILIRIMPTSTVEDYLKQICLEQDRNGGEMVSPGRIAGALEVAPATVTAMMKTLTESGLAIYEPYAGVKLTPAGYKLAMHVLRRHRLIELFLVRFMDMDWSEVHQEAEVLEHAISDRILQRMDEMLGRPSVDPHGDPIPNASGQVPSTAGDSLLTCPTGVPLRVSRVTDQRAEFLQLLERHSLKPGTLVSIDSRDELAGMVLVHPDGQKPIQLGFDAAARILVERRPAED
jgi:DtxR family Mn-dependent transcriptional regulator